MHIKEIFSTYFVSFRLICQIGEIKTVQTKFLKKLIC